MSVQSDPCEHGFPVTPNDGVDLTNPARAIYVAVTGALKVTLLTGDVIVLPVVNAGAIYPIKVARVWSTGTTATGIVALY